MRALPLLAIALLAFGPALAIAGGPGSDGGRTRAQRAAMSPGTIAGLGVRRHMSARDIRRRGLRVSVQIYPWIDSDPRTLRIRVLQVGTRRRHRLVATIYRSLHSRSPESLSSFRVRLRSPGERPALHRGLYELEAAVGITRSELQPPLSKHFRVVR
jgi:hypothetical protein